MKKFTLYFMTFFTFLITTGCSMITIDGEVDSTEQSIIDLAVGSAFTLYPDAVMPANKVSKDLLLLTDTNATVELSVLDTVIGEKIIKTSLTEDEKLTAITFYNFVKTSLLAKINSLGIKEANTKLIIVNAVIKSVYNSSLTRM